MEEQLLDKISLDAKTEALANDIVEEDDFSKVKDLTNLFNTLQAKKNVLRVIKLNALLDKVSDQMLDRFSKHAGEFSNKDLLDYMQVTQSAIDRANKQLDLIENDPSIQMIQNNQVNVNISSEDTLSRESKAKVSEAIKAILSRIETNDLEQLEEINSGKDN